MSSKLASQPHAAELQLVVDAKLSEVVRSFARETALSEGVSVAISGSIASDMLRIWHALCALGAKHDRARIVVLCTKEDVAIRIFLEGHARFAGLVSHLVSLSDHDQTLSFKEHGINGWVVSLHRGIAEDQKLIVSTSPPTPPQTPGEEAGKFTVDVPQRSDAASIARCFLEVYGHDYVHAEVFSPQRYWDEVEDGKLIPVVARDSRNEVIGHLALERGPGRYVAERGEAVVLPAYRGHHLLERMTERLFDEAKKHDINGVYAEPLTIHTFSQRNDAHASMPVCAVLLGVNPKNFHPKDLPSPTAGQRQSYLRTFRFLNDPTPRSFRAPEQYREMLMRIFQRLGVSVSETGAVTESPIAVSRNGIKVNGRGHAHISFEEIGSNSAVELAQAVRDVQSLGAISIQLSARLQDPGVAGFTQAARELGFFFCGLGPAFGGDSDLILLQRLGEPLDIGKLQLFTDEAKELVAFVDADRASVGASGR